MNIVLLDFSPRKHAGNCSSMAHFLMKNNPQHTYTYVRISNKDIRPCGNCNYTCLKGPTYACENTDASRDIYALSKDADIIYYFIPIFSDYPNAYYFMFRERSQSVVNDDMAFYTKVKKRFIFIANTGKENLKNIVMSEPGNDKAYIIMSTNEYHTKGIAGDLMNYKECQTKLKEFFEQY